MPWKQQHTNNYETGFWDQENESEITIPNGTNLYWRHSPIDGEWDRPEADHVVDPQPEVYEGLYSAAIRWTYSTGQAVLVSQPIYLLPNRPIRGSAQYMHVFASGGQGGARAGLFVGNEAIDPFMGNAYEIPNDAPNPFENESIRWGAWASTHGDAPTPDREWVRLATPEVTSLSSRARYLLQFNNDLPIPGSGHFDAVLIEQLLEGDPPVDPPVDPPSTDGPLFKLALARTLIEQVEAELTSGGVDVVPVEGAVKAVLL